MKSLEEHNDLHSHWWWNQKQPRKNGISCPECGEELTDTDPSVQLLSFPPQMHVHCEKCSWKGTRIV